MGVVRISGLPLNLISDEILMRIFFLFLVCALASGPIVFLSACDLSKNQLKIDRSANMEVQDYRDALAQREPSTGRGGKKAPSVPDLLPYVSEDEGNLKSMPLVSVSVNQTVPLRDMLYELATQAGYDIELDPRIKGSIIFTAKNRPFDLVIERIADIAGLRYKFSDDVLRVELDTPYTKNYKIDYLSYVRKNKGSIRNDVSVVSGGGANTGSDFEASTESEADFWGELEYNFGQILGTSGNNGALKTKKDPKITATQDNPAPVAPVVAVGKKKGGGASDSGDNGDVGPGEDAAVNVNVQAPEAVLRVEPMQEEDEDPAEAQRQAEEGKAKFSLNKQAGLISVYATDRQHQEIEKYLDLLKKSVTAQVLIEAKVLEVSLNDEFSTGINWSSLDLPGGEFSIGYGMSGTSSPRPSFVPTPDPAVNFRLVYDGNDVSSLVDAISRFGTVHALASPRLTVLNNQSAVLNVANNLVYFELNVDVTTDNGVTQTNVDSNIRNVPEGVLINVQPSIDLDTGTVSMAVRPTITRVVDYVNDPAVAFLVANNNLDSSIASQIPVVNVQEMDSVVRLHSGETIVMGGLMQDRTESTQTGVPVLSELPLAGALFRNQGDKVEKNELVVFLRTTIVDSDGKTVDAVDKDLYRTFSQDRRPLKL